MIEQTQNLNVVKLTPLLAPRDLESALPGTERAHETVIAARKALRAVLDGSDRRFLAIVGPCSIHDPAGALDYANRLQRVNREVEDKLLIIMRVYFEKPRTALGWKGLINDPHLDDSFDMDLGLRMARQLLLDIAELGLPAATEMLDPITPQYLDDLVTWGAIGARTIESQTHRQMASGLSMPVGFKNSTDGNLQVAINAMQAAAGPHRFLGIDESGRTCIVQTRGNRDGHLILRGGTDGPNYNANAVNAAAENLRAAKLNDRIVVDCSHANCGKDPRRQPVVWDDLVEQFATQASPVIGAMVESNLVEGRQDIPANKADLVYGKSITDPCVDWETTEKMLREAHQTLS